MTRIVAAIYGRNEADHLLDTIRSIMNQTYPFCEITYVDDASLDRSADIAERFGVKVVRLKYRHPSWVATPMLSIIANKCVEAVYEVSNVDYFVIIGSDVILAKNYVEILVQKMEADSRLVICSGMIKGEYNFPTAPRGAGRFYRFDFWDKYIKRFPFCYSSESYPVYKANALGFKTRAFEEAEMYALRPTTAYKPLYGHAMRELGYFRPYAFARCFMAFLKNPRVGAKMFQTYLTSPYSVIDKDLSTWLRNYQVRQIMKAVTNPEIVLRRLTGS